MSKPHREGKSARQLLAVISTLLVACALGGCGGGGGGGATGAPAPAAAPEPAPPASPDTVPPSILSVMPDTPGRVPRSTEISALFSEALRIDAVSDANIRMTRQGMAVPVTLEYESTSYKVKAKPRQVLDLLATYTVTAGQGIRDLAGNRLATERSWSFRTADGSWQTSRRIEGTSARSGTPDVAMGAEGVALAVWSSEAASGWYEIRSVQYTDSSGWSSVGAISVPGNYHAFYPKVRFDAQGNALAVWTQAGGPFASSPASAWSARYLKGRGWQAPVMLDENLTDTLEVSLAVEPSGNAFAAWTKPAGGGATGNADVWAAGFVPAAGWQPSVRLGSGANIGTYDQADQPQVAVDGAGNAYVLWIQRTSDSPAWVARYQAGDGWQPAVSLGATRLGDPFAPRIAVSPAGAVMALWNTVVYAGGPYRFDLWWSVLSTTNGGWSTPALLEQDDSGNALGQTLVADSAGNFHAVWSQFGSEYAIRLQHRRYVPASGWEPTITISNANGPYDNNRWSSLVADRNGNLMVSWGVYGSGYGGAQEGTFARRYIGGEGWQPAARLGAAGMPALGTSLAAAPDGSIAAAWMEPNAFRSDGPIWVDLLK